MLALTESEAECLRHLTILENWRKIDHSLSSLFVLGLSLFPAVSRLHARSQSVSTAEKRDERDGRDGRDGTEETKTGTHADRLELCLNVERTAYADCRAPGVNLLSPRCNTTGGATVKSVTGSRQLGQRTWKCVVILESGSWAGLPIPVQVVFPLDYPAFPPRVHFARLIVGSTDKNKVTEHFNSVTTDLENSFVASEFPAWISTRHNAIEVLHAVRRVLQRVSMVPAISRSPRSSHPSLRSLQPTEAAAWREAALAALSLPLPPPSTNYALKENARIERARQICHRVEEEVQSVTSRLRANERLQLELVDRNLVSNEIALLVHRSLKQEVRGKAQSPEV